VIGHCCLHVWQSHTSGTGYSLIPLPGTNHRLLLLVLELGLSLQKHSMEMVKT
jgi:hypothetical protein